MFEFLPPPALPSLYEQKVVEVATCPKGQSAIINVKWSTTPIKYNFNTPSRALQHVHIDTKNPYGSNVTTDTGGLTNGELQFKTQTSTKLQSYPGLNVNCLWVDKVDVHVVINPTVYVASDYKQGTCKHNAILAHEMKHVQIDQQAVQDYIPRIKQAAASAVRNIGVVGPKPDSEVKPLQAKINAYVQAAVQSTTKALHLDRKTRQQGLDNLQEYQRVNNACR